MTGDILKVCLLAGVLPLIAKRKPRICQTRPFRLQPLAEEVPRLCHSNLFGDHLVQVIAEEAEYDYVDSKHRQSLHERVVLHLHKCKLCVESSSLEFTMEKMFHHEAHARIRHQRDYQFGESTRLMALVHQAKVVAQDVQK